MKRDAPDHEQRSRNSINLRMSTQKNAIVTNATMTDIEMK